MEFVRKPQLKPSQRHRPAAIGEAMAYGPALRSADAAGQCGINRARGVVSAALGGGGDVLDRNLRELVRLVRPHMLVEAMMAVEAVMMPAHSGIGVQHA